ncbi:MAG: Pantothenate kinase type III, CoaX-like (EC [uncultured Thiotrichaceae bacterium]|uniref:Type III pantothenate kinase n=1 Tax=uncultured Thiotrichaceae bacterium TaxID=298394 RepID=A0A6S6UEB8_9GAMM|nr:MAG: Pantothenate kinase type III, CoaX-like (EC [uncultured Thiotrichaceae bacterium]
MVRVDEVFRTLLVDAGNTRLKWSWLQDGQRSEQQARIYADGMDKVSAAQAILTELLHDTDTRRMILVHVLGDDFSHGVEQLCQLIHCQLSLVSGTTATYGIKLAYPNPAHLGADRLVGLAAARSLAGHKAAIIIDCGTAVTVDAITADSVHLGGLITPGLGLLQDALFRRTQAKHMDKSLVDNPQIFTDNTAAAIGSGCLFSLVGTIEGICQRMQDQMTEQPLKIICGGDAARLHEWLRGDFMLRPAALMDGLQAIAEYE